MRDLPQGTVTFVFTDIEGSTTLLHELGPAEYAAALAEHRRVIRAAFAEGAEVDTQGDAFFYAFRRASDALAACDRATTELENGPIRVRIGIHTGEPLGTDEGYVGPDVHRAARIAAAAHGGQIVLSRSTRDLVPDATLRDLGEHRLKDFDRPERLFQLGDAEFPPLRSLYRSNLPLAARPLVGRNDELDEIRRLVDGGHRLVTLTGAGGSGKTRLALEGAAQLAGRFPDGAFFVPLAEVADPARVGAAVAQALRVREQPARELDDVLREHLASRRMLLLVDNVEHVIDAAPLFAEMLDAAPELVVVATSREPLRIAHECELALDPLAESEAAELFRARVRDSGGGEVAASEEEIVAICRQVDCLPLALELAAARVKLLGMRGLLGALDRRLDVLRAARRDVPERQQTLRATIGWSYELLGEAEQRVFAGLSIFAGGCSLAAAQAVCGADLELLGSLLDKSLLRRREEDGELRFWLLHVIREFGLEQLESQGRVDEVRRRHLTFYADLAARAGPELWRRDQLAWLRRLDREYPNLRAALTFALLEEADVELGARIAGDLQDYWDIRGQLREGGLWLSEALRHRAEISPYATARAATGTAVVKGRTEDTADVVPLLTEAAALLRDLGAPAAETRAVGMLAPWLVASGNEGRDHGLAAATRAREAALEAGDDVAMFLAVTAAAEVASWDDAASARLFAEAAELCRRRGDRRNEGITLGNLAESLFAAGDADRAEEALERSIAIARELDDPSTVAANLVAVATRRLLADRLDDAAQLLREAVDLTREHGSYYSVACLPCVALLADDATVAAQLLAAYDASLTGPRWTREPPTTVAVAERARAALEGTPLPETPLVPSAAFELAADVLARSSGARARATQP